MIYNVKSQFDKMCSLLRGSFVLESSSCTYYKVLVEKFAD